MMKKNLKLLSFLLMWTITGFSQDIIVLNDASEVEAKVFVVGINEISYKKWDFQEGPMYQIAKKDVLYIEYANGEKDVFNTKNGKNAAKNVLFNMYVDFGCPFSAIESGPSMNFTLGARLYDYAYVGLSLGTDALFFKKYQIDDAVFRDSYYGPTMFEAQNYSFMINLKGFWPVRENWYPFLEFSFGPDIITSYRHSFALTVLARVRLLVGFEWKRLSVGLGYDCNTKSGFTVDMGYAKVGVRIGKMK